MTQNKSRPPIGFLAGNKHFLEKGLEVIARGNKEQSKKRDRYNFSEPGGNLTKPFFFVNEEFFRFSLLSLAVVQYTHFFHMLQTLKLNSENLKTGQMKVW